MFVNAELVRLLAMAQADPTLAQVRLSTLPDVASLQVDLNQDQLSALSLNLSGDNSNTNLRCAVASFRLCGSE